MRWNTNATAYLYGLTDRYPPFRFGKAAEGEEPYEVDVDFNVPEEHNLFWAIPVIGILVKLIILIPHLILIYVLAIVVTVLGLVTWIPVAATIPPGGTKFGGFLATHGWAPMSMA